MKMQFEKIRKKPSYRILSEAIMEQIMDGRMKKGDQLPTEAELCEIFGVNRSTVREGIRVLEESNLLRREGAKRLVVSAPSNEDVGDYVERALLLKEITFNELWESMYTIEPAMARFAAGRSDQDLMQKLDDNLRNSELALSRGELLVTLDIEFHNCIAALCGNRALMIGHEPLTRLFYPSFTAVTRKNPEAGKRMVDAHRYIVEAIHKHDSQGAEEWMRKHILDFKRGYEMTHRDPGAPVSDSP